MVSVELISVCVPYQVKAERPDPMLGVICGALCIAEVAFHTRFADYQVLLERYGGTLGGREYS